MTKGSAFPEFVSLEYDTSSSGFRDFARSAIEAGNTVKRQFEADFGQVERIIAKAMTMPRNAAGAWDLNTAGLRQAADDARDTANATRQLADAAERAAMADGDLTEATQRRVQAMRAASVAAEADAREKAESAAAYERLQRELDQTTLATQKYTQTASTAAATGRRFSESQRALGQASVMAGQQFQDLFVQIQGGQRVSTALAQQVPQLTYAFSSLDGKVGAVARVLSGPWGLAVTGAAFVLGGLIDKLFETEKASKAAEFSSYGLSNAQSILGGAIDITTGKISTQSAALRDLAKAQILAGQIEARKKIADLRGGLVDASRESVTTRQMIEGRPGTNRPAGGYAWISRTTDSARIVDAMLKGNVDTGTAIDRLEALGKAGKIAESQLLDLATTMASLGVEQENLKLFESSKRLLEGKGTAEDRALLLKPDTKRTRSRSSGSDLEGQRRAVNALDDAVIQAAASVARLRGQFDAAPRDIDRVNAASNELKSTLTEIDRRLAGGKLSAKQREKDEETKRLIEDTGARVFPAFRQRPVTDRIRAMDKELQVQRLLLQGRTDEADTLTFTLDLMRQLNVDTEDQLQIELKSRRITKEKLDLMYAQHQQLIENERVQARMDSSVRSVSAKLQELDRARSSVENAIAGLAAASRKGSEPEPVGKVAVGEVASKRWRAPKRPGCPRFHRRVRRHPADVAARSCRCASHHS